MPFGLYLKRDHIDLKLIVRDLEVVVACAGAPVLRILFTTPKWLKFKLDFPVDVVLISAAMSIIPRAQARQAQKIRDHSGQTRHY